MEAYKSLVLLRILGGLFGTSILIWGFWRFRKHSISRKGFLWNLLIGAGSIIVSASPDSVNIAAGMLALDNRQYGRLITLSIFSNLLLWVFVLSLRNKDDSKSALLDRLLRKISLDGFQRLYPGLSSLSSVTIVIPAYNERENIGWVLENIPNSICGQKVDVIVIDDGSQDDTFEIARSKGAFALKSPVNRGGGAALRIGFDIAQYYGAGILVTMDADGQHLPSQIERLVEPIMADRYDFVIGSRLWVKGKRIVWSDMSESMFSTL